MKHMELNKIAAAVVLVLIAVISFTKVAPWAGNPATHKHTIEQTEQKIDSVLILSGGAAATSSTLSLLPGDMCTPIADQLAELSTYFLIILSALYFEKFLVSLSGYTVFTVLIPLACLLLCGWVFTGKRKWGEIAGKIAMVGLTIFLIVPASVTLSDLVYQTQALKVDTAVEEYNDLELEGNPGEGFLNEFTTITSNTLDRITSFLESLLESLAVMIVTACVIPILVFMILVWLMKTVFSSNVLTLDTNTMNALAERLGPRQKKTTAPALDTSN